jgi:hypothetical protein
MPRQNDKSSDTTEDALVRQLAARLASVADAPWEYVAEAVETGLTDEQRARLHRALDGL